MLPRCRPSAILFTRNLRGKFGFGGCFMESEPHQVACFAGFQWGSVFQCFMVLYFVWCSTFWVLCWKVSVKVSWRRAYEIIRALNILKHENQRILSIRNDHPASVKWTAQSGRFFLPTMETDKVNKVNKVRRFSTWIFVPQEHDPLRPSCVLPAVTSVSPGMDASRDVATASGHSLQRCRLKAGQSCNVFATTKVTADQEFGVEILSGRKQGWSQGIQRRGHGHHRDTDHHWQMTNKKYPCEPSWTLWIAVFVNFVAFNYEAGVLDRTRMKYRVYSATIWQSFQWWSHSQGYWIGLLMYWMYWSLIGSMLCGTAVWGPAGLGKMQEAGMEGRSIHIQINTINTINTF